MEVRFNPLDAEEVLLVGKWLGMQGMEPESKPDLKVVEEAPPEKEKPKAKTKTKAKAKAKAKAKPEEEKSAATIEWPEVSVKLGELHAELAKASNAATAKKMIEDLLYDRLEITDIKGADPDLYPQMIEVLQEKLDESD